METLSFALVFVFVLCLIDRHNLWRRAFKITLGLLALGALGWAGLWGWAYYADYRAKKQAEQQCAAEREKLAAGLPPGYTVELFAVCNKQSDPVKSEYTVPVPAGATIGDADAAAFQKILTAPDDNTAEPPRSATVPRAVTNKSPESAKAVEGVVKSATTIYSESDPGSPGGRVLGKIEAGTRVHVLKLDSIYGNVLIKTPAGTVGWLRASELDY